MIGVETTAELSQCLGKLGLPQAQNTYPYFYGLFGTVRRVRFSQVVNIYLAAGYCVPIGLDRELFHLKPGCLGTRSFEAISHPTHPSPYAQGGPDPIQAKSVPRAKGRIQEKAERSSRVVKNDAWF